MNRIALVAHGHIPIPPPGWGAVEAIIWEQATRLRARGHDVVIVNEHRRRVPLTLLREHRAAAFDWVHVHSDRAVAGVVLAGRLAGFPVVVTGHGPHGTGPEQPRIVRRQWQKLARAQYHVALTEVQAEGIGQLAPRARIAVLGNATETEAILFHPQGNGRALCLGRVDDRKRQRDVEKLLEQAGVPIDFVGPDPDGLVSQSLGEWNRETMRTRIGEWSALVLYSRAEAHPLVVMEALAAGVPVVVSPEAAAHLPADGPFTTIVRQDEALAGAVAATLASDAWVRQEARKFAVERFDYERWIDRYLETVGSWFEHSGRSPENR